MYLFLLCLALLADHAPEVLFEVTDLVVRIIVLLGWILLNS